MDGWSIAYIAGLEIHVTKGQDPESNPKLKISIFIIQK